MARVAALVMREVGRDVAAVLDLLVIALLEQLVGHLPQLLVQHIDPTLLEAL